MTLVDPERITVSGEAILDETPEEIEKRWFNICWRVLNTRDFATDYQCVRMSQHIGQWSRSCAPMESVSVSWPLGKPEQTKRTFPLPVPVTESFWKRVEQRLVEEANR